MKYSLIVVSKYNSDGSVNGTLLQDFTGEFSDAKKLVSETEKLNSNKIKIILCNAILTTEIGGLFYNIIPIV